MQPQRETAHWETQLLPHPCFLMNMPVKGFYYNQEAKGLQGQSAIWLLWPGPNSWNTEKYKYPILRIQGIIEGKIKNNRT